MKMKSLIPILLGAIAVLALAGCGGGGSGGGDAAIIGAADGTGQVALMLTDGPADEYDQIWITIRRAQLLPVDDGDPVTVFDPAEPVKYDLLSLRQEDDEDGGALLAIGDVPAGRYSKIRLEVDSVVGVQGTVNTEFKLSSHKIDLNPRGAFQVQANITLAVTLDIDCDKSIHVSGNHKNFRPVVFVDIERAHAAFRCPRVLQGAIAALTYDTDGQTVTGFDMTLPNSMIQVPILLDDNSVVIDDQGNVADAQVLAAGDTVSVRGRLQEGGLLASLVVVGDVTRLDGLVTQAVTDGEFVLSTATSDQTIQLTTATLILWGCDQELTPGAIQPGMPARVIGKEQEGRIVAVAVLLRPHLLVGSLTAMEQVAGGYYLTLAVTGQAEDDTVLLPTGTPIWIKGDGFLTAAQLAALVACAPRDVQIVIGDPTIEPPRALKVIVLPELVETTVTAVDTGQRLLITDAGTIHVNLGVPVIDLTWDGQTIYPGPVTSLSGIEAGDLLKVYALSLCPEADADYEATTVLIVPALTETE